MTRNPENTSRLQVSDAFFGDVLGSDSRKVLVEDHFATLICVQVTSARFPRPRLCHIEMVLGSDLAERTSEGRSTSNSTSNSPAGRHSRMQPPALQ